eukprot:4364647-Pleurochrysis_carterae.AAC.1
MRASGGRHRWLRHAATRWARSEQRPDAELRPTTVVSTTLLQTKIRTNADATCTIRHNLKSCAYSIQEMTLDADLKFASCVR